MANRIAITQGGRDGFGRGDEGKGKGRIKKEEGGKRKTQYVSAPVQTPWGLQPVSCAGFSCSLIRRSRLPKRLQGELPFKTRHPDKEFAAFSGCDIVFSLELQKYGRQVFCDFDVRPLHLDSKGMVH